MNLTDKEKQVLKYFLKDYNNILGNRVCNDIPSELQKIFTKEEWIEIDKQFNEWSGSPEEHDGTARMMDFMLLYYLMKKMGLK